MLFHDREKSPSWCQICVCRGQNHVCSKGAATTVKKLRQIEMFNFLNLNNFLSHVYKG